MKASQDQLETCSYWPDSMSGAYTVYWPPNSRWSSGFGFSLRGIDKPTLANWHAWITQGIERSQKALYHAALYETLLHRFRTRGMVSTQTDTLRLNELLLEEYQLLNRQNKIGPPMRMFAMQQQHLHFQSAYFHMVGDGAGSLRVYRERDTLFLRNPTLWAEQPLYLDLCAWVVTQFEAY